MFGFCLYSHPSSRCLLLSPLTSLSSAPCLFSLLDLGVVPLGYCPRISPRHGWVAGRHPSSANGPLPLLQGPGCTLHSHQPLSLHSAGAGKAYSLRVFCLTQVGRTSGPLPELWPKSRPHCPGPVLGRGSETWFSRHAQGTLPRYSSLTHGLMPCLYLLLGKVWVQGALASSTLSGAAWVAQPHLPRIPLDWDSELAWGRKKLGQLCQVTLSRPGLGSCKASGDTG